MRFTTFPDFERGMVIKMRIMVSLFSYGWIAIFGIMLSASFFGVIKQKHAIVKLLLFSFATIFIQLLCWLVFGVEFTAKAYPFVVHLPLAIFLVIVFRQSWLTAFISVLFSYQCCQLPRWIAAITYLFSEDKLYRDMLYIIVIPIIYVLLYRYATESTRKLLTHSKYAALILGIMPLLYYIFDYVTTIYTDLLYSGKPFVVQFMPSVMATFFFFFLLIYHSSLEQQEKARQERDLLSLQLQRSEVEFSAMRQMQDQTRQYRHDLRHHFALLLGFAEEEESQKIKAYLQNVLKDMDAFVPKRFCGNDVVDLVLSHFAEVAEKAGVELAVKAQLPTTLPFEDAEICSLLSNGIENAIFAAGKIPIPDERKVDIRLDIRQRNLLLSIQNPYMGKVVIADGIPVTNRTEHGFGTRGMLFIVNKHKGQISFSEKDNIFLLQVMLPMEESVAAIAF